MKIHLRNLKIIFWRTIVPWHKLSLGKGNSRFFSNIGPRPFQRGDNYKMAKMHWQNFKICFSRSTESISTKLGTKHPLVKRLQVCLNDWHGLFQVEIITKWRKYIDEIFFSKTNWANFNQPWHKASFGEEDSRFYK